MDKLVPFPIAQLLKERGFTEVCNHYFEYALKSRKDREDGYTGSFGWKKGELNCQSGYFVNHRSNVDYSGTTWFMCAAPLISDVIDWLNEAFGIWIYSTCDVDGNFYPKIYFSNESNWQDLELRSKMNEGNRTICIKEYKTPKDAHLSAIEYTLTHLLKSI